jgi:hypothetical protein
MRLKPPHVSLVEKYIVAAHVCGGSMRPILNGQKGKWQC